MFKKIIYLVSLASLTVVISGVGQAQAASINSVSVKTRKIVVFKANVSSSRIQTLVSSQAGLAAVRDLRAEHAQAVEGSVEMINALSKRPEVARIEDDALISAQAITRPQTLPWNISRIGAPQAWTVTKGNGIKVALVDTGINLNHPDLAANIGGGINFVNPSQPPEDDSGHGSNVAGIVAAVDNSVGVVGVAPQASLYAVKVLNRRGVGYLSDIIAGIDWAIDQHVDVINLSLGTSYDYQPLHDAIGRANNAGVVVVAASGNSGGSVLFPAAYPEAIAVGMTDDENEVKRQSSRGPQLDLVAPGYRIYSDYKNGRYQTMTGTSMAAPHVTGAAALLRAMPSRCDQDGDGRCNKAEVEARLTATATDLETPGRDNNSGYGLLNVNRAVNP